MSDATNEEANLNAMTAEQKDAARPVDFTISVGLASYQGERFLQAQLDSLARQTRLPYELVVSDDASTDRTIAIVERFAQQAPFPVRIHRNASRLGYRRNFMKAAELCHGDLIAFCDQDDIWHEEKLARCVVPFADPQVQLVCHDANIVDAEGRRLGERLAEHKRGTWSPSRKPLHFQHGFTIVFRRSLNEYGNIWRDAIDGMVPDKTVTMAHDQWFYFLATALGKVVNVDLCLADYRQHGANLFGAHDVITAMRKTPELRAQHWETYAYASRQRLLPLARLLQKAPPEYRQRIADWIAMHEFYIAHFDRRSRVYGGHTLAARSGAVFRIVAAGGYRNCVFGIRGLGADFLFGISRLQFSTPAAKLWLKVSKGK